LLVQVAGGGAAAATVVLLLVLLLLRLMILLLHLQVWALQPLGAFGCTVPGDDEDGEDSDDWVPSLAACKVLLLLLLVLLELVVMLLCMLPMLVLLVVVLVPPPPRLNCSSPPLPAVDVQGHLPGHRLDLARWPDLVPQV